METKKGYKMITCGDLEELKDSAELLGTLQINSEIDNDILNSYYRMEEKVNKLLSKLQDEILKSKHGKIGEQNEC